MLAIYLIYSQNARIIFLDGFEQDFYTSFLVEHLLYTFSQK